LRNKRQWFSFRKTLSTNGLRGDQQGEQHAATQPSVELNSPGPTSHGTPFMRGAWQGRPSMFS